MRTNHVIAALVAVFILWASLFITVLSQSAKINHSLQNETALLNNVTDILNAQKKQPTIADLNTKLTDLQSHVDCLFSLSSQPNHSSAYIANANQCLITAPSPPFPAKSPAQTTAPVSSQNTRSNSGQGSGTPPPKKPAQSTVCKLIKLFC